MATPHITGIAALIKSIHPGFQGKQITDLMRKQAAMEYTRLEAPEDGKEFRGYGFINALTTMRRDQMQPTVNTLEYRIGKGEWKSLDGAVLRPEARFARVETLLHDVIDVRVRRRAHDARRDPLLAGALARDQDAIRRQRQVHAELAGQDLRVR